MEVLVKGNKVTFNCI